jgi:hypothetical protein
MAKKRLEKGYVTWNNLSFYVPLTQEDKNQMRKTNVTNSDIETPITRSGS